MAAEGSNGGAGAEGAGQPEGAFNMDPEHDPLATDSHVAASNTDSAVSMGFPPNLESNAKRSLSLSPCLAPAAAPDTSPRSRSTGSAS
jgi:hypothetical protein